MHFHPFNATIMTFKKDLCLCQFFMWSFEIVDGVVVGDHEVIVGGDCSQGAPLDHRSVTLLFHKLCQLVQIDIALVHSA